MYACMYSAYVYVLGMDMCKCIIYGGCALVSAGGDAATTLRDSGDVQARVDMG